MRLELGLAAALALMAWSGSAAADLPQGSLKATDPARTLEQVLANCDPATGLPPGVKPPPGPRKTMVINPGVLQRPTKADMAAVYPASAQAIRAGGRAVVKCLIGVDGRAHDCQVTDETPPGMGFGEAAQKLAPLMLFAPKRRDCVPVDGGEVAVPITFSPQ